MEVSTGSVINKTPAQLPFAFCCTTTVKYVVTHRCLYDSSPAQTV